MCVPSVGYTFFGGGIRQINLPLLQPYGAISQPSVVFRLSLLESLIIFLVQRQIYYDFKVISPKLRNIFFFFCRLLSIHTPSQTSRPRPGRMISFCWLMSPVTVKKKSDFRLIGYIKAAWSGWLQ